jgi:hypothetical protein
MDGGDSGNGDDSDFAGFESTGPFGPDAPANTSTATSPGEEQVTGLSLAAPTGTPGTDDMTGFGTTAPGAGSDMPEESGGFDIGLVSTIATAFSLATGMGFIPAALLSGVGRVADHALDTSAFFGSGYGADLMDSYSTDDFGPTGAPEGAGVGYARARRASGAGPSNLRAIPPARSATSVARDEEAALRTAARQRRARAVARSPVASTLGSTGGTATIKTLLGA